jgi:hypothetical protein
MEREVLHIVLKDGSKMNFGQVKGYYDLIADAYLAELHRDGSSQRMKEITEKMMDTLIAYYNENEQLRAKIQRLEADK